MQPTAVPLTSESAGEDLDLTPGMALPLPDDAAGAAARDRLSSVDIGVCSPTIAGLGMLAEAVVFIASVQGSAYPRPLLSTRVVLLTGSHAGGVVAGPAPDPRNSLPLQHLAVAAGAGIVTLEWQPAAAAIELEDAITLQQMDVALRAGWAEAERAADEGIELIVLAAGGAGAATAAAAVIAAVTGAEPTTLLARVITPAGIYDDNAWMTRCLALRDALHRVRTRDGDPRTVLSALGGADIAAATGLLLGAARRRTPVMIDGPVGAAAALLANDFASQSRRWVMMADTGRHPAVRLAAESLELRPWLDLCLDLGEGATSLTALPLMQTALTLAGVGEQVEPGPLTHYDSSGNQVFVGVAKAIAPAATEHLADAAASPADPVPADASHSDAGHSDASASNGGDPDTTVDSAAFNSATVETTALGLAAATTADAPKAPADPSAGGKPAAADAASPSTEPAERRVPAAKTPTKSTRSVAAKGTRPIQKGTAKSARTPAKGTGKDRPAPKQIGAGTNGSTADAVTAPSAKASPSPDGDLTAAADSPATPPSSSATDASAATSAPATSAAAPVEVATVESTAKDSGRTATNGRRPEPNDRVGAASAPANGSTPRPRKRT